MDMSASRNISQNVWKKSNVVLFGTLNKDTYIVFMKISTNTYFTKYLVIYRDKNFLRLIMCLFIRAHLNIPRTACNCTHCVRIKKYDYD